ncbi:hypothetical protein ACJJIR_17415 [Microbulbifer sp. SSSA008]|uniref:hypothetical protein n=1 Tax=Microbulbifer sp. SSSA008 TaxID=3243380 RepID=UPI0040392F4F
MSSEFLKSIISEGMVSEGLECSGYSELELKKIARLYDIKIKGQLESFLGEMGKSDGGVIGDSVIQLYRPSWKVREHILFQLDFFNQMQEEGFYDFLNKPFVFSLISETQYYFIQTASDDAVYHYDSNAETVKKTEWDLAGFLTILVNENKGQLQTRSEGNLLDI